MFIKKNKEFPKNKTEVWDEMFSNVSSEHVSLAKKIAFHCLNYHDILCQSDVLLSTATNGQRHETIAFLKAFHFHLITQSQTVHNLSHAYFFEMCMKYYRLSLEDSLFFVDSIKAAEKWYLSTYLDENGGMPAMMRRYYDSMKRLQNDNEDTQILMSFNEFSQIVGSQLESLHREYL